MFIRSVHIRNFKNIQNFHSTICEHIIFISGKNGVGKTNLLDALYVLLTGKSNFTNQEKSLIRQHETFYHIKLQIEKGESVFELKCINELQAQKRLYCDDQLYEKLTEHVGKFPVVMICPEDIELINDGSKERRKYIDYTISQVDNNYLHQLIAYNLVLHQRNAYLKSITGKAIDFNLIDTYNKQLIEKGKYIYTKRIQFFNEIKSCFISKYQWLTNAEEKVELKYISQFEQPDIMDLYNENIRRDIETQRTNVGVHKDDFALLLNEFDVKKSASQGQKKSILIALKLAQFNYLHDSSFSPILMLDDIFEKIDLTRAEKLIVEISSEPYKQVFITDCYHDRLKEILTAHNLRSDDIRL